LLRGVGISVAVLAAAGVLWAEFHLVERRRQDATLSGHHSKVELAGAKRARKAEETLRKTIAVETKKRRAEQGEQKLRKALFMAKTIDINARDGDLYDLYDLWLEGWELLFDKNPSRAQELTIALANQIDQRAPGNQLPAMLARRVAHELGELGDWQGAIKAQERAVALYETAHAPARAAVARDCLSNYRVHRECIVDD